MYRPSFNAVALLALAAAPLAAQPAPIAIGSYADTTRARIVSEVEPPDGFDLTIYAAPPHLTYPTAIAPAGDGVVYVSTDPNLLFGQERHLGRILRFEDEDGDGRADRYTVFADSLDAVRGITVDGDRVYAVHAPTLTAYRDSDGDGVADEREVLIDGLGFGLDQRIGDHTVNGVRLGLDGWLYVAVGDYGFMAATGADGRQLHLHAGGVVRVRPDGSELELVVRGTRNIYDLALDDRLRIFSRDNNNNGQGWNSVFHYLPHGADAGYPSLFRNFPGETHPPIADFGAGAATTTLWVEEPDFPVPLRASLLSADWALNQVYRHDLRPDGARFTIDQEALLSLPRPVDVEVDPDGALLVASLSGGSYEYAGEHVGYLIRLTPRGAAPREPLDRRDDAALLEALLSASASRRLQAQSAILARPLAPPSLRALRAALRDISLPPGARVAAMFTLLQALGTDAHPDLLQAVGDPTLRPAALRALTDRAGHLADVPDEPFREALADADPAVRVEAVRGIARLLPPDAPSLLLAAAQDADPTVAHLARRAAVEVGGGVIAEAFRLLDSGDPAGGEAALEVLSRFHSPDVAAGLVRRLNGAGGDRATALAGTLARLHHREGHWDGAWWGNQPPTEGPYLQPVRWSASARIAAALAREIEAADAARIGPLAERLVREGVLPRGTAALLTAEAAEAADPRTRRLIAGLVGGRRLDEDAVAALERHAAELPAARSVVVALLAADPASIPLSARFLATAAADRRLSASLRARVLTALARSGSGADPDLVLAAHAGVVGELEVPELLQGLRRYIADADRAGDVELFLGTAGEGTRAERTVAFGALLRISGLQRHPEAVRARAAAAIEAGWADPAAAPALAAAVRVAGMEEQFRDRLDATAVSSQ